MLDRLSAGLVVAFVVMLLPLLASSAALADDRAMILPVHSEPLIIGTASGEQRFTVEIADTPERRSRGLMFRETMAADHGMLFVFEDTRPVSFWMKNTPLPLDLVFIGGEGRVLRIGRGVPFSVAEIPSGGPARFVLELNEGTAAAAGIAPGDRVSHPLIDAVASGG